MPVAVPLVSVLGAGDGVPVVPLVAVLGVGEGVSVVPLVAVLGVGDGVPVVPLVAVLVLRSSSQPVVSPSRTVLSPTHLTIHG